MKTDGFKTLVAAVTAADLAETLSGDGPFTVFAPTDDAFAALPEGTLDTLLADPAALSGVLLYHVVSGDVRAAELIRELSSMTDLSVSGLGGRHLRAAGADIRPIASPREAVAIANEDPGRSVVFFAAGFETTTAPVAAMLVEGVPGNLFLLLSGWFTACQY